jgi:hypothetical protein
MTESAASPTLESLLRVSTPLDTRVVDLSLDSLELLEFVVSCGLPGGDEDRLLAMQAREWELLTLADVIALKERDRAEPGT